MVESCEDRRDFWTMLRALAGEDRLSTEALVERRASGRGRQDHVRG